MSPKDVLLDVAEKLPPGASLVDAVSALEFRRAVEEGLSSLDRGEGIPLDEVRKRIPQWASKGSSQERLLPLAQTAWAADWDTPEEDEAWRDL
jgi:hypothetical protein